MLGGPTRLVLIVSALLAAPSIGFARTVDCGDEDGVAVAPKGPTLPANPTLWILDWRERDAIGVTIAGQGAPIRVDADGGAVRVRVQGGQPGDELVLHVGDEVVRYRISDDVPKTPAGPVRLSSDASALDAHGNTSNVGVTASVHADIYRVQYVWVPPDEQAPAAPMGDIFHVIPNAPDADPTFWLLEPATECSTGREPEIIAGQILYVWATALFANGDRVPPAAEALRAELVATDRGGPSSKPSPPSKNASKWLYAGGGALAGGCLVVIAFAALGRRRPQS